MKTKASVTLCWLLAAALLAGSIDTSRAELIHGDAARPDRPAPADLRRYVAERLQSAGVSDAAVHARVHALTDDEIVALAAHIDEAPAGGYAEQILLVVVGFSLIIAAVAWVIVTVVREHRRQQNEAR